MIQTDAHWIWSDECSSLSCRWVGFAAEFEAGGRENCILQISADTRYRAWINGVFVGDGPPRSDSIHRSYDEWPVSDFIQTGRNIISVLVFSFGNDRVLQSDMPLRGGLRAWLGYDDVRLTATNTSWFFTRDTGYRQSDSFRAGDSQPWCEVFDQRMAKFLPGDLNVEDPCWKKARVIDDDWLNVVLEESALKPCSYSASSYDRIREMGRASFAERPPEEESVKAMGLLLKNSRRAPAASHQLYCNEFDAKTVHFDATELAENESLYLIFDFGRNWQGSPFLEFSATTGTHLDVSYAEALDAMGNVVPTKNGLNYLDRVIAAGPRFSHQMLWPVCFRYVRLDIRLGKGFLYGFTHQRISYLPHYTGGFSCGDRTLNACWEISAHTLSLCMHDTYMDSPWRERGSWLGDILPEAAGALPLTGDTSLLRRFLKLHARGQSPDGSLSGKFPAWGTSQISTWSLTYSRTLEMYCRFSADDRTTRDLFPVVENVTRWLLTRQDSSGLFSLPEIKVTADYNRYNFVDWAPVQTCGQCAAWNAFAYAHLVSAYRLRAMLGIDLDRDEEQAMHRLKEAFRLSFWNEKAGHFQNFPVEAQSGEAWGVHENALAVIFDLASAAQREILGEMLCEDESLSVFRPSAKDFDVTVPEAGDGNWMIAIATNHYRWPSEKRVPTGSPYFAWYLLQALFETGRAQESLAFIRRRWGEFVRQGSTSTWEAWNENGTLSHGFSAGPVDLFTRYVLGFRWDLPGDTLRIYPQSGGLAEASGRVALFHGVADIHWMHRGSGWTIEVDLPEGIKTVRIGCMAPEDSVPQLKGAIVCGIGNEYRYGANYRWLEVNGGGHLWIHIPAHGKGHML